MVENKIPVKKVSVKKISEYVWEIEKSGKMNVPARIYASEALIEAISQDKTLSQIQNVACLPGIVGTSIAMPDAHQGYGFSIGGVAAFNLDSGIISPGGVGYDINCGVRLLATNITKEDFLKHREKIVKEVNKVVPSGMGYGTTSKLSDDALKEYLLKGSPHAVAEGFGRDDDLKFTEDNGVVPVEDSSVVSPRALARGRDQLGTLGSGNHFLEFQFVDEIFDEDFAKEHELKLGTLVVMIHCGSRGLGHQIASDYIKEMEKEFGIENLPDRELVHAPIKSDLGQKYLSAMNCAINFAFSNRQIIMHRVREVLESYFPDSTNRLVYDVAHNIAKIEEHEIDGKKMKVCVHRKGATRALHNQPVIIPGSMGTASYVLRGSKTAESVSFGSTAHGAGRVMSRSRADQTFDAETVKKDLLKQGILVQSGSKKGVSQEAPGVYKDIEEVAKVSEGSGIATRVARLKPLAVIKG